MTTYSPCLAGAVLPAALVKPIDTLGGVAITYEHSVGQDAAVAASASGHGGKGA